MTRVPILTEVVLRAWGTDDPRVLGPLRAENQPGSHRRTSAVEDRAQAAGWPTRQGIHEANKAALAACRRLEHMQWDHRSQGRRSYKRRVAAAAQETHREQVVAVLDEDQLLDPASIFDE